MRALIFLAAVLAFSAAADPRAEKALEKSWMAAREYVYPAALTERFDDTALAKLKQAAADAASLDAFAEHFNRFLDTLGRSHTRFVPEDDPDYAFFLSLFGTHQVDQPASYYLGAQFARVKGDWVVRTSFDPRSELQRGDVVLRADEKPFHPMRSIRNKRSVVLDIRRQGKEKRVQAVITAKNPHRGFVEATRQSAHIFAQGGKKIGYVHLWTGTDDENLQAFHEAVAKATKNVDGLVLDLRDGFGGAWWPYLDDFYADSSKYFSATFIDRAGKRTEQKAPRETHARWYSGPMVVIINEGTRSGKEALAQFFKTSGRAKLVGTNTAGAVCSGRMFFAEKPAGYLLFLSAGGVEIDGVDLEGKGVAPHQAVPFALEGQSHGDPQLDAALELVQKLDQR